MTQASRPASGVARVGVTAADLADIRIPDDAPVIQAPSTPARFGDDFWDITAAFTTPNISGTKVNWSRISSSELRYAWKAIAYTRLRRRIAGWTVVKAESIPGLAAHATAASRSLSDMGVTRPSEITPALAQELLRRVKDREWSPAYAEGVLNAVVQLYAFREHLPDAPLRHPFKGKSPREAVGSGYRAADENSTPRIPEEVMAPALQWALRYINDFAVEILNAPNIEPRGPRSLTTARSLRHSSTVSGEPLDRLESYLDGLRCERRGLPTKSDLARPSRHWKGSTDPSVTGRIDWETVSNAVGTSIGSQSSVKRARLIDAFIADVGLEADRCLRPDEAETLAALRGDVWTRGVSDQERRYLALSCYIVIAYLTGMRDSEVKGLRRDCLRQTTSSDGLRTRWYVSGHVYKHRATPEQADWVAIDPVVTAVRTLEQLNDLLGVPAADPLVSVARLSGSRLNDWREHVNRLAARAHSLTGIPAWSFNTRQFRRTFAWYIANRPGGVIAGMIQYQQASIQIFEGYHGVSKSGFRAEVDQERALAQQVALLDVYEQWQEGLQLMGTGAAELATAFAEVQSALGSEINPTDRRIKEMLRAKAVHLQVGVLTDCRFDEASARCLQMASKPRDGKPGPLLNVCNKRDCAHAVVTAKHIPVWRGCIADTEALLGDSTLSVPQRAVLEQELRRQLTVIGGVATAKESIS